MTQDPGGRSFVHGRPDLDWQQFADALWLTICSAETDREAGLPAPAPPSAAPPAQEPPRALDPPRSSPTGGADEEREPEGDLVLSAPHPVELVGVPAPSGETPGQAIAADVVTPAPRLVSVSPPTAERALSRALRPLRRTAPSPVEVEIDEDATAERAAREGLWLPACVPVRERWMDIVLVVDSSSSMVVWRQTVSQLVTHAGAGARAGRAQRHLAERRRHSLARRQAAGPGAGARSTMAAPLGAAGDPAVHARPPDARAAAGGTGRALGAGAGTHRPG
ncbi:hypothetical protein AB4Z54_52925, partial [Streptomyces sp. MCAF7]